MIIIVKPVSTEHHRFLQPCFQSATLGQSRRLQVFNGTPLSDSYAGKTPQSLINKMTISDMKNTHNALQ